MTKLQTCIPLNSNSRRMKTSYQYRTIEASIALLFSSSRFPRQRKAHETKISLQDRDRLRTPFSANHFLGRRSANGVKRNWKGTVCHLVRPAIQTVSPSTTVPLLKYTRKEPCIILRTKSEEEKRNDYRGQGAGKRSQWCRHRRYSAGCTQLLVNELYSKIPEKTATEVDRMGALPVTS